MHQATHLKSKLKKEKKKHSNISKLKITAETIQYTDDQHKMIQAGNWYLYYELRDKYIMSDMHSSRSKISTAGGIPRKKY